VYAIIETGGKQYKAEEGETLQIEQLDIEEGEEVAFEKVLAFSNDEGFKAGQPYLEGVIVKGRVVENARDEKVVVFKYKPKKNYRKKQGHRQPYSKVVIEEINVT